MHDRKSARRPHVVVLGNQIGTMIRFRGSLLALLVSEGLRVTAMCPAGSDEEERVLRSLGVEPVFLRHLKRASVNPIDDLRLFREIRSHLRALRPTHILSYFLKPAIYGTLSARQAGVPRRVALIEGLGFSSSEAIGLKRRLVQFGVRHLLRRGLEAADRVVVLNEDDRRYILDAAGVPAEKVAQIDGIGIDLDEYVPRPAHSAPVTFTLAARLIREKGVSDFADAAKLVKRQAPQARFLLLGGLDDGPTAISRADVMRWENEGLVEWKGHVDDVRPWLGETSVFVLPSFYGEGLPRSIMEAMAMGRPIITSSGTGCRESITEGVSGFIVEPRRPDLLAAAMLRFVDNPDLVKSMGEAASEEARRRYDGRRIDRRLMDLLLA